MNETVGGEKAQAVRGDVPVRINTVDSAPPRCERTRDYFGLESRMTITRLLRNYLETVTLTPTELLHSRRELQRLQDKDTLLQSAADCIATLQCKDGQRNSRERRDEIFAAFEQIKAQARQAEDLKLPRLGGTLSETLSDVADLGGDSPEYLAMVVLSAELIASRNWLAKLERLCKLALAERGRTALLMLDAVIADVLAANVVQEVLGWQPSLGTAIVAMLDLADGAFDPAKSEVKDVAEQLNRLLAAGRLPATRFCLMDRAFRQLRSTQPLSRNDPAKEMEEYQRVLARLLTPGGLMAGPQAAEALTVRGTRFVEQGGATGRRAAIVATCRALPDRASGVMYLSELTKTGFAEEHLLDIVQELDNVFSIRVITELCRRSLSPKDRMVTATGAFNAAKASALPDDVKLRVADHIDGVLERYLTDEKIIEKLDNPESSLRDRAVRLVKFCGAGVLPEGKALKRARERIVLLLRQPNFDARFVEGITDKSAAELALRDFHQLLSKAGFR